MKYLPVVILITLFIIGFSIGVLVGKVPQEKKESVTSNIKKTMQITSEAFNEGGLIPPKYTCDGEGVNPPLTFSDVPSKTKSLALIVDDPDIPDDVKTNLGIEVFDHWVLFDISAGTTEIGEGAVPETATEGQNSRGKSEYAGMCPPDGEHRYFFKLYALDTIVSLPPQATKEDVEEAMAGHVLDKAELIGLYKRQ